MSFVPSEIIRKKRDGAELSQEEIEFFIKGISAGTIPEYQASAWLMASFLKKLNLKETVHLTRAMKESGRSMNWRKMSSSLQSKIFFDKHSSGGIGDKVSLILAPLAACCGLSVPMMSGRGLGHTGGTVDKLESIPGMNMYPSEKIMLQCLEEVGALMMAQASDLCPADRLLYSLRDVTATVESAELITASIVSKKWAEGVDGIVYDVKCGEAAFMQDIAEARHLAKNLVNVSAGAGLKVKALITRMVEPLGAFVGNALEIEESLHILGNVYPSDNHRRISEPLKNLSIHFVAEMLVLSGLEKSIHQATEKCEKAIQDGSALKRFHDMLKVQGATEGWQEKLPKAPRTFVLESPMRGVVGGIASRQMGLVGLEIAMGRKTKEDKVDPAVGFEMLVKVGDEIERKQPLIRAHLQNEDQWKLVESRLLQMFNFVDTPQKIDLVMEEVFPDAS